MRLNGDDYYILDILPRRNCLRDDSFFTADSCLLESFYCDLEFGWDAERFFRMAHPAPNPEAFDAIHAEWSRLGLNSAYAERVAVLKAGFAVPFLGTVKLDETTVSDDLKKDSLTGGNDLNWFIISPLDVLKDQMVGTETKTTV